MMNTDEQIPPPPQMPDDDECCQSGCEDLCVFEIYRAQKAEYEKRWGVIKTPT